MKNALVRQSSICLLFVVCQPNTLCSQVARRPSKPAAAGPEPRIIGPNEAPQSCPEAKAIPQPKNEQELADAVKKLTDELAKSGRFSGSIFLLVDGEATVNGGWGEANRETQAANTPETAYDTGSIGKLCTQIAILQLLDAGKLTLNDPIAKYLPDYPDPDIARKVTIRQLLLHQSGIPDFLSHVRPDTKLDSISELKDFLPLFIHQPLEFEPGTAQRYSSSGYIVLGSVIEAV